MKTFAQKGKYDHYFYDPPSMTGGCGRSSLEKFSRICGRKLPDLDFNFHSVNHPYVSKKTAHTHDYHEFLAWFGSNPAQPEDFGAEIELYMGEDQERYLIDRPALVWLPPGFRHGPMTITRIDKPVFQIAVSACL